MLVRVRRFTCCAGWFNVRTWRSKRLVLRPIAIVDRLRCTFLLDEADTLFGRSTVLAHIVNESWTNSGAKIPRVGPRGEVMEFDVYGTQAISMKGLNMSDTTLSRCIICMIWPKLPSEVVDDFNKRDDEEFVTLRRKLLRWSVDNAVTLQAATPEGQFNNRIRNNWQLLWAIADLAGGEWPKRARAAALELETERDEPSEGLRLAGGDTRYLWHARVNDLGGPLRGAGRRPVRRMGGLSRQRSDRPNAARRCAQGIPDQNGEGVARRH